MTTNIPPCLYLGQYSSQLNDEINKISLELLNSNNIDKSVIDIGLYNKKFDNKIIIENLMKVLEKFDTVTCLHYVSDLGNFFYYHYYDMIIYIHSYYFHLHN